jgi:pSer/pThr/pTyr-binding forkhead associated (FHA) protein
MFGMLRVTAGPDEGRIFSLTEGQTLVLGRGSIGSRLRDPHVGRVHCQVKVQGGKVEIADLSSACGTLVNGQRVALQQLEIGDVIQIGDTRLSFQWSHNDEPDTDPG